MQPNILLLTTVPPGQIKAEWPYYQNWTLPNALRERGASVTARCWRDENLDVNDLVLYDVITFLWCNNYHLHPVEFPQFIQNKLLPAQELRPSLKVANDAHIILWNTEKTYLNGLEAAGFVVPKTQFVRDLSVFPDTESLAQQISTLARDFPSGPVILKPSISGSSKQTYRIKDPNHFSSDDHVFLAELLRNGIDGALIVQEFESAIANGEYSLVFIAGKHTHTMVKTPARGEFRCQAEFGGGIGELTMDEVPDVAKKTAKAVMNYMDTQVGAVTYCRVDGVVRQTGEFVLMEVEAIEPHLWLETCNDATTREALYGALLDFAPPAGGFGRWLLQSLRTLAGIAHSWLSSLRMFFRPNAQAIKL